MIANNIKNIRNRFNYTIDEMASAIGVPARTIAAYERRERTPSVLFVQKLLQVLGININWFLTGVGDIFVSDISEYKTNEEGDIFKAENFGKRLSSVLCKNKLTDRDLSAMTGIRESRIAKLILNTTEVTTDELVKIKNSLDVSVDWLLFGENTQQKFVLSDNEIIKLKKFLSNL